MEGTSKKTRGRQKIVMKKINKGEDRLVTFSKRRSGIYKKAGELVTMCGAEVGIIIFSQSGKPYSFGHPSVESICNKFLERDNVCTTSDDRLQAILDGHRKLRMDHHNYSYRNALEHLDTEKERAKALKHITQATKGGNSRNWEPGWWERPLDEFTLPELTRVSSEIEAFHKDLCTYLDYLLKHHPSIQLMD